MGISAPKAATETISSGSNERFVFPQGTYEVTLEAVRSREIPTGDTGQPFAGWVTADGTVLGLQFGGINPLDADVEVGDRKYFVDITLSDGELTLDDVDIEARDVPQWQLQRSARTLLNLLTASGHAEEEDGNMIVADEVIDMLAAGELNGMTVGVEIGNRKESTAKFKQRLQSDPTAERRTYDFVVRFFAI